MPTKTHAIGDPDQVLAALNDPAHSVPTSATTSRAATIGWLRNHVARFCDGPDHERRRALAVGLLNRVPPSELRKRAERLARHADPRTAACTIPVAALADAMGVPGIDPATVAIVAGSYHPHTPVTADADRAVGALVDACGGLPDEHTAAMIGLLVQAYAATAGLVATALQRIPDDVEDMARRDPPVRITRRVRHGLPVELDLASAGLPFGAGAHACPGRRHAVAITEGVLEARR